MTKRKKTIMLASIFAPVLIVVGVVFLVLGSLPMENRLNSETPTVKFIIGKKAIDMTDAKYLPVPDDVNQSRPARPWKIWKTWSGTGGTTVTVGAAERLSSLERRKRAVLITSAEPIPCLRKAFMTD